MARIIVFKIWLTTAAAPLSTLPSRTSAARSLSCFFRAGSSPPPLPRPPLLAILRRFSALAGSCAQQHPLGPVAGAVQGEPSRLFARHTAPNCLPPSPGSHEAPVPVPSRGLPREVAAA